MRITFDINTQADFEKLRAFFAATQWTGEEEALPLSSPSSLPSSPSDSPINYPITPYNPPLPEEEEKERIARAKSAKRDVKPFGKFVMLTEDEHSKLVAKFGERKAQDMIQNMDFYIAEDPKRQTKYRTRNHYMTLLNWERKREEKQAMMQKPKQEYKSTFQRLKEMGAI